MSFEQADKFRMRWEGGLSDDAADPGGITNYGVSLRFLRSLGHDVDGDGDIDADDIRCLTPAGAALILRQEFWTCQDLDSFPPLLAIAHYDASVNCGRGRAVRCLQAACNAFDGPKIDEDGRLGPKTRSRIADSGLNDELLALRVIQERQAFYKRLVSETPKFSKFIDGWMNRTNSLIKYLQEIPHGQEASVLGQPVPGGDATQDQPSTPVLPTDGLRDEPAESPAVVQTVGSPVQAPGVLTISGIRLSKKLCVTALGALVIVGNSVILRFFNVGLNDFQIQKLGDLLTWYIGVQGGFDIAKPFFESFFTQGGRRA